MSDQANDPELKIESLFAENQELRARLEEAEETLRAITAGEVDALVVHSKDEERIYTLQGADYTYRIMIESINEGAANITPDGTILYCNKRLAEMLNLPLEKVLGSSLSAYLPDEEKQAFASLTAGSSESPTRGEYNLRVNGSSALPVLISTSTARVNEHCILCLVVTDLTEQKKARARERELQVRLMEQREQERVRIAHNLHDGPIQDLIGISFALEDILTTGREQGAKEDLEEVRENVHRIIGVLRTACNELRPPNIIQFGLSKALQAHRDEFSKKYPELNVSLEAAADAQRISKDISSILYRIYQECMNNIARHANATSVTVRLFLDQDFVLMEVQDNGRGFELPEDWVELAREDHLGLVGMRERAEAVGGSLRVLTAPERGTTIRVEVPYVRPPLR